MKAVGYDRFGGIDELYLADVAEPHAGAGEVVVRVEAGALNPGALPALNGSPYTPGRDLAGEIVTVGEGVLDFAVGDAVLGRVQSWEAHAQLVAMPADQRHRMNRPGFDAASFCAKDADHAEEVSRGAARASDPDGPGSGR